MSGKTVLNLLSFDNVVFNDFAFYTTLVLLKVMIMSVLTIIQRLKKNVFSNPEDAKGKGDTAKISFNDPDVERVRRNHLNDLENVPLFVFLGLLYVATNPGAATALWHFRIFVVSRFLHTITYQLVIPQPSRALSFMAGVAVNISLAVRILIHTAF